MAFRLLLILIITGATSKSFVSTAPAGNGLQGTQDVSDEVQQLEELRKENDKPPVEHHSLPEQNGNLRSDMDSGSQHASQTNAQMPSKSKEGSRSAIFRHRGITEAKKNHVEYEPQKQDNDEFAQFSGIQYSPADLAEYIFRTGDEEGVALAVEDLVKEGMMGRTDAINYLQDVKEHLMYLKEQYETARRLQDLKSRTYSKPQISQRLPQIPREQFVSELDTEKREPRLPDPNPRAMTTAEPPRQVVTASTAGPKMSTRSDSTTSGPLSAVRESVGAKGQQPESPNVEGLGSSNSFYDEFTLEDVMYQFAKYMFIQSMSRGDQTAEDTLSRLITFLETEVDNKRISRKMKEKVLEIVSAALVDSLREYPGLLTGDRGIPTDIEPLYRPGNNQMVTDKRSLQEKVNQKPMMGALKTRQMTVNGDGSAGTDKRMGLTANAQSLQPANSASIRSKRT